MSIRNISRKIKAFGKREGEALLLALLVVFVGIASYGLGVLTGRESLSKGPEKASNVVITDTSVSVWGTNPYNSSENLHKGAFVASRSGTVYYPLSCAGADRIKEENRIYFSTSGEAELAGLKPASTCTTTTS